jgi:uncharacterized membrane protein
MKAITESAPRALLAGLAISLVILVLWVATVGVDVLGLLSFLLRWVHVGAAILWVGMIWFVNFIQLAAIQESDDAGRRTLMTSVVPRVAHSFRHASHLTLLTGVLLMMTSGYLFNNLVFSSSVYLPASRTLLMWGGVIGGIIMWAFVHFIIWPNLKIVLGQTPGNAAAKDAARQQVRTFARLNLVLAVPVTFAMVAAPHLY